MAKFCDLGFSKDVLCKTQKTHPKRGKKKTPLNFIKVKKKRKIHSPEDPVVKALTSRKYLQNTQLIKYLYPEYIKNSVTRRQPKKKMHKRLE